MERASERAHGYVLTIVTTVTNLAITSFEQSFLEDKGFSFKPELVSRLHCTLSKGSGTSRSGHPLDEHAFVSKVGCLVGCGPVEERSKIFFSLHTANAEGKVCECGVVVMSCRYMLLVSVCASVSPPFIMHLHQFRLH